MNAPDSSNQEYKHARDADQIKEFTQMDVPDCSFPPVGRCLFHWCLSAKPIGSFSSFCFMLFASGIFFGLTSRQMETRDICVPAFA